MQELVDEPDHDRAAALRRQRTLAQEQLTRAAALVDALDAALTAHDNRELSQDETLFEGLTSMTQLVLVDARGEELARCGIESRVLFERGHSVDLGPVGYFHILEVRAGDPLVLVAERAERKQFAYEIAVRREGVEERRGLIVECSARLGDRLRWPPERGADPVDHKVVEIRLARHDGRSVLVLERPADC